jgi:hypothetical protein
LRTFETVGQLIVSRALKDNRMCLPRMPDFTSCWPAAGSPAQGCAISGPSGAGMKCPGSGNAYLHGELLATRGINRAPPEFGTPKEPTRGDKMSKLIQHGHNGDGIGRRGFLQCMPWAPRNLQAGKGAGRQCYPVKEFGVPANPPPPRRSFTDRRPRSFDMPLRLAKAISGVPRSGVHQISHPSQSR